MNVELSLKDLKAVLDDNTVDLSMRQLVYIPVKALSKLPRATHLDFSNNLITSIPPDFCLLTHITKLDLSNNKIVHLPQEFGKLSNLVHLDLYKNEIEELPLSFGKLTSLKWLDLKGNPLELELLRAAGECLDEKGCRTAALNVVRLMRDRSAKQQELLEKQRPLKKESDNNDAVDHSSVVQKEKTKKKKSKNRGSINEHFESATENVQQSELRTESKKNEKASQEMKKNEKRKSNNGQCFFSKLISFWWRITIILFISGLAVSIFAAVAVTISCFSEPQNWSLSSKPYCEDLQTVIEYSFPPTIFGNFLHSFTFWLKSYTDTAVGAWQEVRQRNDLVASAKNSFYLLYMKLVSVGLLLQGYAVLKYETFMAFYDAFVADAVNNALTNIWLLLRIFGLMFADLLMFLVGESFFFISSVVETIFTYAYRGDQLAEVLRDWFRRIK